MYPHTARQRALWALGVPSVSGRHLARRVLPTCRALVLALVSVYFVLPAGAKKKQTETGSNKRPPSVSRAWRLAPPRVLVVYAQALFLPRPLR